MTILKSLTNPDKLLFKDLEISKFKLANFYISIKNWILPYVINRPLSILRCPEGSDNTCFYQKHPNETIPETISFINVESKKSLKPYLYIKNLDGLISLIQLGALEIHIWNSTINNTDYPDQLVFDLDPGKDVSFLKIADAAILLNTLLKNINLKGYLKTTGKKGLNIIVPLSVKNDYNEVKDFAKAVAQFLAYNFPELFIAQMNKNKRKGKIFIDYLRNNKGATFIAPYSTRAIKTVGVSTPLSWEELKYIKSSDYFNINNLSSRLLQLTQDPWKNFLKMNQIITKEMWGKIDI